MTPDPHATHDSPLDPVYALGPDGRAIVLFEGTIGGVADTERPGRIELILSAKPSLNWMIDIGENRELAELQKTVDLHVRWNGVDWTIAARQQRYGSGWINTAAFTAPHAQLQRVLTHWVNLPSIVGPVPLTFSANGRTKHYAGRWQADIDGWSITLDLLPNVGASEAADSPSPHMITHTMQITKTDGAPFTVEAITTLIESLRVSLSFAFGRWVAPILPVGFDASGTRCWESWNSPICDPPRGRSYAWLSDMRSADLTEFMSKALPTLSDAARPETTNFQMHFAVEAAGGGTFVEHRIMSAFSAIENLEWVSLVLSGQVPESDYRNPRKWSGAKRLRTVLDAANIPTRIDASSLPALARFANDEGLPDGPAAVVEVRNRLIHPKRPRDDVYHIKGLTADTWLLVRHDLNLLILHSLGYGGSYQKLLPPFGWAGAVSPVPWAPAKSP